MPSRGRKFITEFLLPSLNEKRFGSRLMWLDIENKVFQMQWNHKSASNWTTSDAAVFAAWDQRKGHYKPDDKEYYPKSKQRFRAALYKFIREKHITELYSEDKYNKIYCIGDGQNIFRNYTTAAKCEKGNDRNGNTSQKVKQNPENLVLDLNSIFNGDLFEPQENNLVIYNYEMKKEYLSGEEQVVADDRGEIITDLLHSENSQNSFQFLNSFCANEKNFSARETSCAMKESDVKSLHIEFHIKPEKNICKKDYLLKRVVNIENNFHDYLCTGRDTSRQVEWPDFMFDETDGDLSFGLPLAASI